MDIKLKYGGLSFGDKVNFDFVEQELPEIGDVLMKAIAKEAVQHGIQIRQIGINQKPPSPYFCSGNYWRFIDQDDRFVEFVLSEEEQKEQNSWSWFGERVDKQMEAYRRMN